MRTVQLKRYVRLAKEREALKAKQKKLQDQIDKLEESLAEQFINDGLNHIACDGHTVYLRTDTRVTANGDTDALKGALETNGFDWLLSASMQRVGAWVRELTANEEPIPDQIKPFISVKEYTHVAIRKS